MAQTLKEQVFATPTIPDMVVLSASATLTPKQGNVLASGTLTVTLPPVTDCNGLTFMVFCTAGSSNITIAVADGSVIYGPTGVWSNDALTAANDIVIIRNVNGHCWSMDTDITT